MSLFDFFGNSSNKGTTSSRIEWNALTDLQQLDIIVAESEEFPVLVFKHSTRCSISRFALKQFEADFKKGLKIKSYFLDLLEHREISNEIASRFGVQHQSPQLLVIRNGKCIYDASHQDIQAEKLEILPGM